MLRFLEIFFTNNKKIVKGIIEISKIFYLLNLKI